MRTRSSRQNPPPSSSNRSSASPQPPDQPETLHDKCIRVLDLLDSLDITLGGFIHSVFYGDPTCQKDSRMRDARTTLFKNNHFAEFLANVFLPPRCQGGGGHTAKTGRNILLGFASETILTVCSDELVALSKGFRIDNDSLADWDKVSRITSDSLSKEMQSRCPHLWKILAQLASNWVPSESDLADEDGGAGGDPEGNLEGLSVSIKPHPHFGTILCIGSLVFRSNRLNNKLQAILAIYAHAKKTDEMVHNLFHQAGITLSYRWVTKYISHLCDKKREQAIALALTRPILMVHDNIRMPFKVRSERAGAHSVTDNGMAITMIVLPEAGRVFEDADEFMPFFRQLRQRRIDGTDCRLSWSDFMDLDRLERLTKGYEYDIIDHMRMIPGVRDTKTCKSTRLDRPIGPRQIPSGKQHRTQFEMLPTVDIDESTYSGNKQVIDYVLNHLKLTEDEVTRNRLALEQKIPWMGDQLSADRLEMLQLFSNECYNPIDRLDCFVFYYALFHSSMALGSGTYETLRGTKEGLATLARSANLLNRTGLNQNMNKTRPEFHRCDEALLHNLEARMRLAVTLETGCNDEAAFVAWVDAHTPEDVLDLVSRVFKNHVSEAEIARLKSSDAPDTMRLSAVLANRDLLRYYSKQRSEKYGDADRIYDLLFELLIFYCGAGNSNYSKQTYNFIQLLLYDLPPSFRNAILQLGLLVNCLGRPDSFYPIDQRQEHNNAGIRKYAPSGSNATWAHIEQISPAIPFYMQIVKHVEENILGQKRSHVHKDPKREADVQVLMQMLKDARAHIEVPGRTIDPADAVKDCMEAGSRLLQDSRLKDYAQSRETYYNAISDEVEYGTDVSDEA